MLITANTREYTDIHLSASTITKPDTSPSINWSLLIKEDKKRERFRKRGNKIHIYERRKDIFR